MIPERFIEELKYVSDIETLIASYVTLKRKGRTLTGLCPFHSEKTPSFTVYPENQSYYCFGCGNGGDVITFVRQIENLEYVEAVRFLAQKAGLTVPEDSVNDETVRMKTRIYEINRASARFFYQNLMSDSGQGARVYLQQRGITNQTLRRFGLGYAPAGWDHLLRHLREKGFKQEELLAAAVVNTGRNNSVYDTFRDRLMFPIIDLRGNVIGFGGRIMQDGKGPKYLNSSDTLVFKKSRNLFALNFAKSSGKETLLLGEGYMDVIAMHQAGFENAVATLGTSLTEEQARLLSQYAKRVCIAYDSDEAGQKATRRAINLFNRIDVSVSVLEMQGAKDPDEYIKKFGAQRFERLIESGKGAVQFEIDKLKSRHNLDEAEERVAFLKAFCELMAGIEQDLQREVYIGEVARELDMGRERLIETVQNIRKRRMRAASKKQAHNLRAYAQDNSVERTAVRKVQGLSAIVAEEKLITMLLKHPDYFALVDGKLTLEDFTSEENRQIWQAIAERLRANKPVEMIYLSAQLPPQLMAKLSRLEAAGRVLQFYRSQTEEYVAAILAQRGKKSAQELAQMTPQQLQDYLMQRKKRELQ